MYNSSEVLQRGVYRDTFKTGREKEVPKNITEVDKISKVLDKYIAKYSSTVGVREEARKNKRTNDYQLDLSADIVEILTEVKNKLR
nr:MAG TPA: hypothetical protein [Caudoviricetes sp.]